MSVEKDASFSERVLIRTKLRRPPVAPDILPRERLLSLLQDGFERTLTLISAPAGYGKSTLASRWVSTCNLPQAWVTLDHRDTDLRTFLGYVLGGVRQIFPNARLLTEAILEVAQLPPTEVITRQLLNDLDSLPEKFVLVLDDYHNIRGGMPPNDLVEELLTLPPEPLHLVIVTRRDPALPLTRLRARGQLTEIRAADLRFTADEALEFLSHKLRLPIDRDTVALLEAKTEGWVTGLRLAGLSLRGREDPGSWAAQLSGSSVHIAEYLVTEVLSRQRPEFEGALTVMSVVDRFCAPLCQALYWSAPTGGKDGEPFHAGRFIDWLVETNLFVVPLDDRGYWHRYHSLFRDYLQSLLRQRSSPERIAELHARASAWLAEAGLIDEAIRHALTAGDTAHAARLAIEHRYELMNTSQFSRLASWLELLPKEKVAGTPLLVTAGAFIGLEQGQDAEVYRCTRRAQHLLAGLAPKSDDYAVLKSEVLTLQSFIDMAWGRIPAGCPGATEALASLPGDALLIRSLAVFSLAFSAQMAGDPARGAREISKELSNTALPANIRARLHFYASIISYTDGDLQGTLTSCIDCLRIACRPPISHTRAFASYLSGACHYWRNELVEAGAHLLDVTNELPAATPSYATNASFILACIELARGRAEQATEVLERVRKYLEENGFDTALTLARAFAVEMALKQNDLTAARRLARTVNFELRPPVWFFYVPQLTPLKLLLAKGSEKSLDLARSRLVEMDDEMRKIHRTSVRIDVLALLALVHQAQGDEDAALKSLRTALELAEPGLWVRNFVDLGVPMFALLHRLVADEPDNGFAMRVYSACGAEIGLDPDRTEETAPSRPTAAATPRCLLTHREAEILALLGDGLTNQEVADRLFISLETVKTHLQNIYGKLNARGRVRALAKARGLGLIPGS